MIFIFIIAAVFGLDYIVKSYVEKHKAEGDTKKALGGAVLIRRFSNRGAAGGLLKHSPKLVKWSGGILVILMGICFFRELLQKGNMALKFCYSSILGGALSNLYDRIKKGAVTDYFSFQVPIKKIRNLIFNISDLFIIGGAAVMFVLQLKHMNGK